jgi:DNA-binding MarR family transcriptional regulator
LLINVMKAGETMRKKPRQMQSAPRLDHFLCFAVYSANHAFNRLYKPLLDELGLTYPQYLVMVTLWEQDGRTVSEIGDELFLESNTLTPLIKRIEAMGLVSRSRDLPDERRVRVSLSTEGKMLREKAASVPGCILDATMLSAPESRKLIAEISALRDNLGKASASNEQAETA